MVILNLSDFYSGIFHLPKKIPADRELHNVGVLFFHLCLMEKIKGITLVVDESNYPFIEI